MRKKNLLLALGISLTGTFAPNLIEYSKVTPIPVSTLKPTPTEKAKKIYLPGGRVNVSVRCPDDQQPYIALSKDPTPPLVSLGCRVNLGYPGGLTRYHDGIHIPVDNRYGTIDWDGTKPRNKRLTTTKRINQT